MVNFLVVTLINSQVSRLALFGIQTSKIVRSGREKLSLFCRKLPVVFEFWPKENHPGGTKVCKNFPQTLCRTNLISLFTNAHVGKNCCLQMFIQICFPGKPRCVSSVEEADSFNVAIPRLSSQS